MGHSAITPIITQDLYDLQIIILQHFLYRNDAIGYHKRIEIYLMDDIG